MERLYTARLDIVEQKIDQLQWTITIIRRPIGETLVFMITAVAGSAHLNYNSILNTSTSGLTTNVVNITITEILIVL